MKLTVTKLKYLYNIEKYYLKAFQILFHLRWFDNTNDGNFLLRKQKIQYEECSFLVLQTTY